MYVEYGRRRYTAAWYRKRPWYTLTTVTKTCCVCLLTTPHPHTACPLPTHSTPCLCNLPVSAHHPMHTHCACDSHFSPSCNQHASCDMHAPHGKRVCFRHGRKKERTCAALHCCVCFLPLFTLFAFLSCAFPCPRLTACTHACLCDFLCLQPSLCMSYALCARLHILLLYPCFACTLHAASFACLMACGSHTVHFQCLLSSSLLFLCIFSHACNIISSLLYLNEGGEKEREGEQGREERKREGRAGFRWKEGCFQRRQFFLIPKNRHDYAPLMPVCLCILVHAYV